MQTCSKCNASSQDTASYCIHCAADLRKYSATAVALARFRANPRVKAVRVTVAGDACPVCYEALKTYPKDKTPRLPLEGCSHEHGCRCFYEPVLSEAAIISKVEK
ncbi:MAG: hypothetical protein CO064_00185 [Anaerolineae bacterium CG_4_9_14_0_8_um_filter_58_9]|nr:MAG: hypothetical protein CO064_00185 [Anaerolineae bacterium CG_4_9_14_0_8_um_filter_58_9]